jgi:hypothetical protein
MLTFISCALEETQPRGLPADHTVSPYSLPRRAEEDASHHSLCSGNRAYSASTRSTTPQVLHLPAIQTQRHPKEYSQRRHPIPSIMLTVRDACNSNAL